MFEKVIEKLKKMFEREEFLDLPLNKRLGTSYLASYNIKDDNK